MRVARFIKILIIWMIAWHIACSAATAQTSVVQMTVQPGDVGFAGCVRVGTWTPMQVRLQNRSALPQQVLCQWLLADGDGDQIYAQRRVTLSAGRTQEMFLYAVPAATTTLRTKWRIRVLEEKTNRVLAAKEIRPKRLLENHSTVIGLTTVNPMGLTPYATQTNGRIDFGSVTQHEPARLVTGIVQSDLPDRWYGLEVVDALVWTPGNGEVDSASGEGGMSAPRARALREWIQRGGHLVVVLPAVGSPWDELPIDDLLPPLRIEQVSSVQAPAWLGKPTTRQAVMIDAKSVQPADTNDSRGGVLLRGVAGLPVPLVSAFRVGHGRITLVGVDLTDVRLARAGLPNGRGLWSTIFRWQSPVYPVHMMEKQIEDRKMSPPSTRYHVLLDRFIPRQVTMRETASPALLAAIITFGIYWLAAGPVGFTILRSHKMHHHSWVVFLGVVAAFSILCWGGALMIRPTHSQIAHLSVVDVHADEQAIRTQSWASLFVPAHGKVNVQLGGDLDSSGVNVTKRSGFGTNTMASPGWDQTGGEASFIDPQWYRVDGGSPDEVAVPIRATAKQFQIDYVGRLEQGYEQDRFITATGPIHVINGWPKGTLKHNLPGTLKNVRVLYCPGGGFEPWVWQPTRKNKGWDAGEALKLVPPKRASRLILPAQLDTKTRQWKSEGYLGNLIAAKTGQSWGGQVNAENMVAGNEVVQAIEMLSFYGTLPPPDFRNVDFMTHSANYDRSIGRGLDLTHTIWARSLIVIGHLEKSPLPVPMRVDGEKIESNGWTVIRWTYPLKNMQES